MNQNSIRQEQAGKQLAFCFILWFDLSCEQLRRHDGERQVKGALNRGSNRKINAKNVWDILKLHVSKEQEPFVAPNGLSLIEAYIAITGNGHAFPFGVFEDEVPVGFVMVGYDVDESFENPPQIAYGNYSIWRLMIDEKYQRRGYGRQALRLALEFVRTFPCGKAEYCYLSYEPENAGAKRLYSEFGFQENGEMDGEEIVAVLKL